MSLFRKKAEMPAVARALAGRPQAIATAETHFVFKRPLKGPLPEGCETVYAGMGCFWGAERMFWQMPTGIVMTAVGYQAGFTPNATYDEVCSGQTGHNETVLIAYNPKAVSLGAVLQTFWENHDPTQGMRQGNDVGTQYRSGIYTTTPAQKAEAMASKEMFQNRLSAAGFGPITTEIIDAPTFYYAEDYHQQYLAKVPNGYCGLGGTGVSCPIGVKV
jgi:peptide-methionine (S)-S-oxide reductase